MSLKAPSYFLSYLHFEQAPAHDKMCGLSAFGQIRLPVRVFLVDWPNWLLIANIY